MTTATLLVLMGAIIALVCLLAWQMSEGRKERAKLLNLIVAKTPQEVAVLESADKAKAEKKNPLPDLIPEDSLTQEQLQEMIKKGVI